MKQLLRILHLEDLESDVFLIKKELQKGDLVFEHKVVDTRETYEKALKTFHPDIILSDHSLPAFNSAEALNIMKKLGLDLPFILVTGNVSEEFAVNMMRGGAWDYVLKDRIQRLPNAVINAVEKYKLQQDEKMYVQAIIKRDNLFKQAERIAHFGIWTFSLQTMTGTWSDETYRLLGFPEGSVIASYKNFFKNIPAADMQKIKQVLSYAIKKDDDGMFEFEVKAGDGRARFVKSQFVVERNPQQSAVNLTGFLLDITETKLVQESNFKLNADLSTIFKYTDTAYILLDDKLAVRSFNTKASLFSVIGFGKELKENTSALSYFPEDRQQDVLQTMRKVQDGEKISYEINYGDQASTRWFNVTWIPIDNLANRKFGLILAIQDITERKIAEIEKNKINFYLSKKNQDLRQFNYIVSHNLRLPLTNILALTHLVNASNNVLSPAEMKRLIQLLEESSLKLDEVIKDLNVILEIKDGIGEALEKVNVCLLIQEVFQSVTLAADEQLQLECDVHDLPDIYSIKSYLYSIFLNLISNSLRFRKENQPLLILVRVDRFDDRIEVVISDNGKGFDTNKARDKLFGLYKRFHQEVPGKGMGLFMVKAQLQRLGGDIDVQSKVGNGTTFTITLPLHQAFVNNFYE